MNMKELRILIVEDDAIVADDIYNFVQKLGHAPFGPAYNVKQAQFFF